MIKALPYDACIIIGEQFKHMYEDGERQPETWKTTTLNGMPKESTTDHLNKIQVVI